MANYLRSQYSDEASRAMDKVNQVPNLRAIAHPAVQSAISCLMQAVTHLIEDNTRLQLEIEALKKQN